jgi:predicted nucleotidyltransferase
VRERAKIVTNAEIVDRLPWSRWNSQPWLRERTIMLTKHGSHAYGLNRPTSDIDVKGIAVPTQEYFLGFLSKFTEADNNTGKGKAPDEIDCTIFDIRKFCALAADCNPSIIEILYTAEKHWLLSTPAHRKLVEGRDLFISKKARYTFSGYAHGQLKRIEGHYKWLRNPPTAPPNRGDYGLPDNASLIPKEQRDALESLIRKQIEAWDIDWAVLDEATKIAVRAKLDENLTEMKLASEADLWTAAGRYIGVNDNMLEILAAERRYRSKKNEWDQYQNWKANRNPERAALEEKYGYDTKHGMHLVRLLKMAKEILQTGQVFVDRKVDKDELLSIRDGSMPYEALVAWAKAQDAEMDILYKESKLPREPNRPAIDKLCVGIVEAML